MLVGGIEEDGREAGIQAFIPPKILKFFLRGKSSQNDVLDFWFSTTGTYVRRADKSFSSEICKSGKSCRSALLRHNSEYEWPMYNQMMVGVFLGASAQQTSRLESSWPKITTAQPGTFPKNWMWDRRTLWVQGYQSKFEGFDQCDEKQLTKVSNKVMGPQIHPMVGYHEFDGGEFSYRELAMLTLALGEDDVFLKGTFSGGELVRYAAYWEGAFQREMISLKTELSELLSWTIRFCYSKIDSIIVESSSQTVHLYMEANPNPNFKISLLIFMLAGRWGKLWLSQMQLVRTNSPLCFRNSLILQQFNEFFVASILSQSPQKMKAVDLEEIQDDY